MISFILYIYFLLPYIISSCHILQLHSDYFGDFIFHALSLKETNQIINTAHSQYISTGRVIYKTKNENKELYLYHTIPQDVSEGVGRWVINDKFGAQDRAFAFVNSWAVMPHLVHAVNDPGREHWAISRTIGNIEWEVDYSLIIKCVPRSDNENADTTVFIDTIGLAWPLSGFYVQLGDMIEKSPVYLHVNADNANKTLYLFKKGKKWVIGNDINSSEGLAYVNDNAPLPGTIESVEWYFASNKEWQVLDTSIIAGNAEKNIYARLRDHRKIGFIPGEQTYIELRNGMVMPTFGLGTGGINLDSVEAVLTDAMRAGYRMFDTAREYGTERHIGQVISSSEADSRIPLRNEMFITSKVWPTHLGFSATSNEIQRSLEDLESSYVDMYMIHWPICDSSVEWMFCDYKVDKDGTWEQSYRALERAYAEGRIMAIGVSNFDTTLLNRVREISEIAPHAVQNHETIGSFDMGVRKWCFDHNALFVPYATARSIDTLSSNWKKVLDKVAKKHGVSQHVVVHKLFLQVGSAIIPRATTSKHIKENLGVHKFELSNEELELLGWDTATYRGEL